MKTKEESVRRREDTVRKTEMEYENRLHSEMSKYVHLCAVLSSHHFVEPTTGYIYN